MRLHRLNKNILVLLLISFPVFLWAQLTVNTNLSYDVGHAETIVGLDTIVIFEHLDNTTTLTYTFQDSTDVEWYFLLPDSASRSLVRSKQTLSTTVNIDKSGTYQLKTPEASRYFAVVDYSLFQGHLDSVWVDDSGDSCQSLRLCAHMQPYDSIAVYSPNQDRSYALDVPVTYFRWENVQDSTAQAIRQAAPFQDTTYTCYTYAEDFFTSNDLLVKYYNPDTLTTVLYEAKAVSLGTLLAEIVEEDGLINQLKASSVNEGSAPLDVTYTIDPSASVEYSDWWVWDASEDQPNSSIYPFEEQITYTFFNYVPNGYRVKVEVGNQYCTTADSTEIKVYDSALEAPNIMVLSGEYGKYKIAYQSIDPESFRATIYDQWGRRIYQWNDPDGGWDGRSPVTQAYVSPGVYYCAVKARGTDGKKHDNIFEITAIKRKR